MLPSSNLRLRWNVAYPTQPVRFTDKEGYDGANFLVTSMRHLNCRVVGHNIYVVGRLRHAYVDGRCLVTIGVLDVVKDCWRWVVVEGPEKPGCVFLYRDTLLWYGSLDMSIRDDRIAFFDLILEEWTFVESSGSSPGFRRGTSGHYMEETNQMIHFGGKRNEQYCNDVHLLKMPERRWVTPLIKGKKPKARWKHGSCVLNGILYVYGGWGLGGRSNDGIFLLSIDALNMGTWSNPITNLDSVVGPGEIALAPFKGVILVLGGEELTQPEGTPCYELKKQAFSLVKGLENVTLGVGFAAVNWVNPDSLIVLGTSPTAKFDHVIKIQEY